MEHIGQIHVNFSSKLIAWHLLHTIISLSINIPLYNSPLHSSLCKNVSFDKSFSHLHGSSFGADFIFNNNAKLIDFFNILNSKGLYTFAPERNSLEQKKHFQRIDSGLAIKLQFLF